MEISGNKSQLTLKILMCWQTSDFPHLHFLFELSSLTPEWEAESPAELSPALSACSRTSSDPLTTPMLQCQPGVLKHCYRIKELET